MTCEVHGGIPFRPPTQRAWCKTQKTCVTAVLVAGRYLCPDCDVDLIPQEKRETSDG